MDEHEISNVELLKELRAVREDGVRHGEQIKTLFKQQEDNRKLTESVYKLTGTVEKLAGSLSGMERTVGKLTIDIDTIKQKPAKRWDSAVSLVLTVLMTAAVTYFLTKIGLK